VVEQRYQAVLAVIADGRTVSEVAGQWPRRMARWRCECRSSAALGLRPPN